MRLIAGRSRDFHTASGGYYDLLNQLDFRPFAANTVAPSAVAATAPINPAETLSFGATDNPANDKKFPKPGSPLTAVVEQYVGRRDLVVINRDGNIGVIPGMAAADPNRRKSPRLPRGCMQLNEINVPPYPNLPIAMNQIQMELINIRTASMKSFSRNVFLFPRDQPHGDGCLCGASPVPSYTMRPWSGRPWGAVTGQYRQIRRFSLRAAGGCSECAEAVTGADGRCPPPRRTAMDGYRVGLFQGDDAEPVARSWHAYGCLALCWSGIVKRSACRIGCPATGTGRWPVIISTSVCV